MKNIILASIISLMASGAYAADAVVVEEITVIETPDSFSWTGSYIGLNAGFAWNSSKHIRDAEYHANGIFDSEDNNSKNSITGGGQIGYNYQIDNIILGIEADLNFANLQKEYTAKVTTTTTRDPNYIYNYEYNMQDKNKIEWFGTIRPRLGFTPTERLMVYATGGLAYGKVKSSGGTGWKEYGYWWGGPDDDYDFDRSGSWFSGSSSKVQWGWTIGAGAEYAITEKLSLKGEFLYVDLGKKSHSVINPGNRNELITWKNSAKFNTVRVGVNYRF